MKESNRGEDIIGEHYMKEPKNLLSPSVIPLKEKAWVLALQVPRVCSGGKGP